MMYLYLFILSCLQGAQSALHVTPPLPNLTPTTTLRGRLDWEGGILLIPGTTRRFHSYANFTALMSQPSLLARVSRPEWATFAGNYSSRRILPVQTLGCQSQWPAQGHPMSFMVGWGMPRVLDSRCNSCHATLIFLQAPLVCPPLA